MDKLEKQIAEKATVKANLETELINLQKSLDEKKGVDAGLEAAVSAKKVQLASIGDEIRKAKADKEEAQKKDQGKFEAARNEHLDSAKQRLVAEFPDLADAAKLGAVVTSFSRNDSGKFETDAIYRELKVAYFIANPDKMDEILQSDEARRKAIADEKAKQAAGVGKTRGQPSPTDQSPEEKYRGKDTMSGGLLSGGEKIAY